MERFEGEGGTPLSFLPNGGYAGCHGDYGSILRYWFALAEGSLFSRKVPQHSLVMLIDKVPQKEIETVDVKVFDFS